MAEFYVERQHWARWPRVLLMCRKHGNMETGNVTVERRRYVPVGGTVHELEAALRKACEFIADYGSCPYDTFDLYEPWEESCHQKCSADIDRAECWRRYFEKGDSR